MPVTWKSLIKVLSDITRENCCDLICCSHCGNDTLYAKWGTYERYLFDDGQINIQRYRCYSARCPRKTFSILPHAFLPVMRASLCMLLYVLKLYETGLVIAEIVRLTEMTWPRIQRWILKAQAIQKWLYKEYGCICSGFSSSISWSTFCRDFSWTFYPDRFR